MIAKTDRNSQIGEGVGWAEGTPPSMHEFDTPGHAFEYLELEHESELLAGN